MTQEFKATMDKNTKSMTAVVVFIVFMSIIPLFFIPGMKWYAITPIISILVITFIIAYLLRPVKYIVDETFLTIQKGIGKKEIELNSITEVREVNKKELGGGIRTFGVGGFFGYYGKFYYSRIGNVTAYITNLDKIVFIKTKQDKKYLISPDDVLEFMNTMNKSGLQVETFTS